MDDLAVIATIGILSWFVISKIIAGIKRRDAEKSKPEGKPPKLVVTIANADPPAAAKAKNDVPPVRSDLESLDSIYARNTGKRLCQYCETINPAGSETCCACGNRIEK